MSSTTLSPPSSLGAVVSSMRANSGLGSRFAWIGVVALYALYVVLSPNALSVSRLSLLFAGALTLLLVGLGQTLCALLGEIDLSVGGVVSVTTVLVATRMHDTTASILGTIGLVVVVAAVAGAINGLAVVKLRLHSFIVTLATWSILSGVALNILPTTGGDIPPTFVSLGTNTVLGIGVAFWLVVALAVASGWFRRTRIGLWIKATGSDTDAASLAGIPTRAVTVATFAISGVTASLAGLFLVTRTTSGSPTIGDDYILTSVAAVVIGGTSLFGGRGGLSGTIAGALVLTLVSNVVFALRWPSHLTPMITGGLLILAVVAPAVAELRRNEEA